MSERIDPEALKRSLNAVEVIGRYVALKPMGPGEFVGLCPFHSEKTPSFTVTESNGLFHCFGCSASGDFLEFVKRVEGLTFAATVQQLAEETGVPPKNAPRAVSASANGISQAAAGKITAIYHYTDATGQRLYEICRIEPGKNGKPKDFMQRYQTEAGMVWKKHPNQVLYNLPDVTAADEVFVCEGEKDADTLMSLGFVATTAAGGAKAPWLPQYTEALRGKCVVILPDQDETGLKRGDVVRAAIVGAAASVCVLNVPIGKDVTDFISAGNTADDLRGLIEIEIQNSAMAKLEGKGFLSPMEIVEITGGFGLFINPSKRPPGLMTGFERIDELTRGMHPGTLIVLAARPSMGKSSLAGNIAVNVAKAGAHVHVSALEQSRLMTLERMVCAEARVDMQKFRLGFLNQGERHKFSIASDVVLNLPIKIDDTPGVSYDQIIKRVADDGGSDLFIIDHLGLMDGGKKSENRTLEVGNITKELKKAAKRLQVPIVLLCQLNRMLEQRASPIPQLSDLRDSGRIEEDADVVMFIYRPEYYKREPELRGIAEIIIAKQRDGPIGKAKLAFHSEYVRFDNWAGESER